MIGKTVILIVIISYFIIKIFLKFNKELEKDEKELNLQSLEEKFSVLIDGLNEYCYKGLGVITKLSPTNLNLYKEGSCQIINMQYGAGILRITWKFVYFQQEMIYKCNLEEARNVDELMQTNALKHIIQEFLVKYKEFERKIDSSDILEKQLSEKGISLENFKKVKGLI
jgi:hypothetical protein